MPARRYATLNPNAAGPLLAVDESSLRVTTTATCTMARTVLCDQPALAGARRVELYVWSRSQGNLSNLYGFGVAPSNFDVTKAVGELGSFAFLPATGKIRTNGADVTTVDVIAERICLGLSLSLSPTLCTCTWLVQGSPIYTATLPNGKAWLFALSLGSSTPGDVSALVNFGSSRFDTSEDRAGWSLQSAGLPTFYLSLATEEFLSQDGTDTRNYERGLLSPDEALFDREPLAWFHREPNARTNPAGLATLTLSNRTGNLNALALIDAQDSRVTIRSIDAPPGAAGTLTKAATQFTGALDRATAVNQQMKIVVRDRLATLDHSLPLRLIPPFYDDASAGQYWPFGFGARRSLVPKLLYDASNLYALGDAPQSNVVFVGDGGAPLSPGTSPPQYVPALSGAGIKIETPTEFKFTVDCSNQGGQAPFPGTPDILGGKGAFTTWVGGAPDGFLKCANPPWAANIVANGLLQQTSSYGRPSSVRIVSNVGFDVASGRIGYPGITLANALRPGKSYIFRFKLLSCLGWSPTSKFGFAILTKVSSDPRFWITPHMEPLGEVIGAARYYEFHYTVPASEPAALSAYFVVISQFGGGALPTSTYASAVIDDLTIEELAAYVPGEMKGTNLRQSLTTVLVDYEGLPAEVIAFDEIDALDAATGYEIGMHYDEPPNTLDLIQRIVDNWGGVVYTDEEDDIHVGRLTPPEDGAIVAAFDRSNFSEEDEDEFWIGKDPAVGLTNLFGGQPNISPFASDTDFVSDYVMVPESLRAQLMRADRILYTSTVQTAQRHSAAKRRMRFQFDKRAFVEAEANRVRRMFVDPRSLCIFVATYTNNALGLGPFIAPQKLRYNHAITVHRPDRGLIQQRMKVVRWRHCRSAKKMLIKGWF